MPSISMNHWQSVRLADLDEIESAHRSVGGSKPGGRRSTRQVNQAYAVLLCAQFQAFCRELHDECAEKFVRGITPDARRDHLYNALKENRKLDRGNPNSGNLGGDFGRFGVKFWAEVRLLDSRNKGRQARLDALNQWRNAIAHQDFAGTSPGKQTVRLEFVRDWRSACEQLAVAFDEVMRRHLASILGVSPW